MSESDDKLDRYKDKRSAGATPEPFGGRVRPSGPTAVGKPALFVIQQHDATRMHWDLRLEFDGVLRSWAVPRGLSQDPADKRMAVLTEDHPLEYVDFEGVIPEGNYGAGSMIVWDRGSYVPLLPMHESFDEGKLLFELRGYKMRGVWTLVRTKGGDGKQWLVIKKPDSGSTVAGVRPPREESVLSGLTVHELASAATRVTELRAQVVSLGAPQNEVDFEKLEVMQAQPAPAAHTRKNWIYELKYDGFRVIARRKGRQVSLRYRSGIDCTDVFPEIARSLAALPVDDFVVDGEAVVLDPDGRPNFQRLQQRTRKLRNPDLATAFAEHPVTYYAFDVLQALGHDLRGVEVLERKAVLERLVPKAGPVRFTDHIVGQGVALFEQVKAHGLEGIVAKRADSRYMAGRHDAWEKIRLDRSDDFVIVGSTKPKVGTEGFGSLLVATHLPGCDGPVLTYAGRVGTGFTGKMLSEIWQALKPLAVEAPACQGNVPTGDKHRFVKPELVCEVRYKQITDDGHLRHPVFLRLRDDKLPNQCQRAALSDERDAGPAANDPEANPPPPAPRDDGPRVIISNPKKVLWPQTGTTKTDLINYYRAVTPFALPYLKDRPIVLTRYPDGVEGKSFFQKNAPPYVPGWLRTQTVYSEHGGRDIDYFVVDDADGLAYLANMAAIVLHVWSSRVTDLQRPDWCILDLDPKDAPFEHVVEIALEIKKLCDELGYPSFVKTSGATGLHVLLPVGGQTTHDQTKMLGQILARVIVDRLPKIATIDRVIERRAGRVYIDFGQNGHGRLLVSAYSVRPRETPTVSTPLFWDEVKVGLDPATFTIDTVLDRFRSLPEDPLRHVLETEVNLPKILQRLGAML